MSRKLTPKQASVLQDLDDRDGRCTGAVKALLKAGLVTLVEGKSGVEVAILPAGRSALSDYNEAAEAEYLRQMERWM